MASSSPTTSLASSFSSDSCFNSTCGLFSVLDLNHSQTRKMGDMNTNLIVDVPDTPDRLVARQNSKGKCVWKETHSSLPSHLNNSDPLDGKRINGFRGIGRLVNENDHKGGLVMSRKNHIFNDVQDRGKSIDLSSPENSHASPNHHYRRAAIDKPSNLEKGKSIGALNMDNVRSKIMPSMGKENNSYLDVNIQNDYGHKSQIVSENGVPRVFQLENVAKDSASFGESSSILHILDSPKQSSHVFHGKEKVNDNTSQDLGLSVPHSEVSKNSSDGGYKFEKQVPEPHYNVTSTRSSGRKRLVRNGCISPHNIAMKAKQLVNQESSNSKSVFHSLPGNTPSAPSPCLFNMSDIASEGIHMNKHKGKGVIVHPSTFQAYDTRNTGFDLINKSIHESTSNTAGDTKHGDGKLEAAQRFEEFGGWRSTRSRSTRIDHPFSDASGVSSQMKSNNIRRCDSEYGLEGHDIVSNKGQIIQNHYGGNTDANHREFRFMSNVDKIAEQNRTENELSKRQKKQGFASINNSKCGDIICLDSPGESSNSRSSRIHGRQSRSYSILKDPVVGVDKLSPGMAQPVSRESGYPNNDESHDARMRQLEADEKLARELQEQLYHDLPFIEFNEFDENIALALQQEEETFLASSGGIRSTSQTRRQSMAHSRRQPQSRTFQIPSNRTGTQRRASNYNRVGLRSRFSSSSSRAPSRDRGFRFPLDMDLDMRIDILEALEAAVGDDVNDTRVSNHIFQLHHDFNDADYEMLLTLDDNNHCHAGATVNQINTLPQSTVQTENFEEACAVCLETPTTGDIIRHLPCFHKFHKDCIDPWLRRKTSCPVCKFSIT